MKMMMMNAAVFTQWKRFASLQKRFISELREAPFFDDRRRTLKFIDTFRERDTRDELGIGVVRDAFSDPMFPGTSTCRRALELHRDLARTSRRGAVAEFSDPHEEPVRRDRLSASWDPRPPTFPRDLPGEIVASAHARGSRIPAGAHPYRRARLAAGPGRTLVLWTTSGARDSISPIELAMECATADGIAVEVAEDRSDALR